MKIKGQETVLNYIQEAFKQDRLPSSFLFIGPEGVGKKCVAFELAKYLLCSESPVKKNESPVSCGACDNCQKLEIFSHPDVLLINRSIQAEFLKEKAESQTGLKIQMVREAEKFLQIKPFQGKNRLVIFEEAERLTTEAANALLKTLEEPPKGAHIILFAPDEKTLLPTIVSRCALCRFSRIPTSDIAEWLAFSAGLSADDAWEIAQRSDGSFSKAAVLKDQESTDFDIARMNPTKFFELLSDPGWRREGRQRAKEVITYLIEQSQGKLEKGDLKMKERLLALLAARRQLDRNVPPRLVLENAYLKILAGDQSHKSL